MRLISAVRRRAVAFGYGLSVLVLPACSGGTSSPTETVQPPAPTLRQVTVRGVVRLAGGGPPVAGARISLAGRIVAASADGTFSVPNVETGTAVLQCAAPGYGPYEVALTLPRDTLVTIDLRPSEVFELVGGTFVLWIPRSITQVRGVLFVAGGPDTRAFADPSRSFNIEPSIGAGVEPSLIELRARYRQLAQERGLAILGIRTGALPEVESVLNDAATATARDELRTTPLLVHGISGGTLAATRVASQLPTRIMGMVLRVPVAGIWDGVAATPTGIPTLVITAAQDQVVANAPTLAAFLTARQNGGLWAYVNEPGVGHYDLTPRGRAIIAAWLEAALDLRMPAAIGGALRTVAESDGLLGNLNTLEVSSWGVFAGERRTAAWLPSTAVAALWQAAGR